MSEPSLKTVLRPHRDLSDRRVRTEYELPVPRYVNASISALDPTLSIYRRLRRPRAVQRRNNISLDVPQTSIP